MPEDATSDSLMEDESFKEALKAGIIASLGLGNAKNMRITRIVINDGRRRRLAGGGISVEFELTVEHPEEAAAAAGAVSDPDFADNMVKHVQAKIAESPGLSSSFEV